MSARWTQLSQSDLNALATKANAVLLPLVNAAITSNDWPGTPFDTTNPSAPPLYLPQPNFSFSGSSSLWVQELNRIRADYWQLVFGKGLSSHAPLNSGRYLNPDNLVSGPWVVGVNDPDTFPGINPTGGPGGQGALDPAWQGILPGNVGGMRAYRNVKFLFALTDAPDGVTITGRLNGSVFGTWSEANPVTGLHPTSAVMQVNAGDPPSEGTVQWEVSPANTKGIWIATTLPVPALNVFLDQDMPPFIGGGLVAPGETLYESGLPILVAIAPDLPRAPQNEIGTMPPYVDNPPTTQDHNNTPILASGAREQGLLQHGRRTHVVSGFTIDDGPNYNLLGQLNRPRPTAWLVRRDTDFFPFNFGFNPNDSEQIVSGYIARADGTPVLSFLNLGGVVGAKLRVVQVGTAKVGWQNGQRQYGSPLTQNLAIFALKTGVSFNPANPTTYDFVTFTNSVTLPGDGGFGYLAVAKAAGQINYAIGLGVPRGPHNLGSNYQYGDLVTDSGNTYKYINAAPSIGAVLTDGDYWEATSDVTFDLVTEVDSVVNPQRQYFPVAHECFSYCLAAPGNSISVQFPFENQPIPQTGYCIFKVRAKRWPVQGAAGISRTPASGPALTVVLGQNQLQPDGTMVFAPFGQVVDIIGAGDSGTTGAGDSGGASGGAGGLVGGFLTITIPADAAESGDVEVFIPVLGGNELVWQCDTAVIVEAFANWQPKFFGQCYNIFYFAGAGGNGYSSAEPGNWSACLQFANFFDIKNANYTPGLPNPWSGTKCLFPMAPEIYNDKMACLDLL